MKHQKLWNVNILIGNINYNNIPKKMFVKTDEHTAKQLAEILDGQGVPCSAVIRPNGEATVTVNSDFIEYAEQTAQSINPSFVRNTPLQSQLFKIFCHVFKT